MLLGRAPWVLNPPGCPLRASLIDRMERAGFTPTIAAEVHNMHLQLAFVQSGHLAWSVRPPYSELADLYGVATKAAQLRRTAHPYADARTNGHQRRTNASALMLAA